MTVRLLSLVILNDLFTCTFITHSIIYTLIPNNSTYMAHSLRIQTRNQGMNMMPKQLL